MGWKEGNTKWSDKKNKILFQINISLRVEDILTFLQHIHKYDGIKWQNYNIEMAKDSFNMKTIPCITITKHMAMYQTKSLNIKQCSVYCFDIWVFLEKLVPGMFRSLLAKKKFHNVKVAWKEHTFLAIICCLPHLSGFFNFEDTAYFIEKHV